MTRASGPPALLPPDAADVHLEVDVINDLDVASELSPEWEALADRCGAGPLVRPRYALAWWRHLGKGRLLVVTLRDAGRLVALAPLHERRLGPFRMVRWLGHGLGTVAEVLVDPDQPRAGDRVWDTLSGGRRAWDLVECRDGAVGLPAPGRRPGGRRTTVIAPRDVCPEIDLAGGYEGLLATSGKKNLRRMLKRWDRALADGDATYHVTVATTTGELEAQLPDLRAVMDAAEADRTRLHLLQPPYEGFVLDYLRALAATGDVVSLVAYVDGVPAAVQVLLRDGDTLSFWIARFDPRFGHLSPGHLAQRDAVRWAADHGITRIDLLLGDSQMKRLWATGSYGTLEVMSGHPVVTALVRCRERVGEAVRSVPG